MSFGSPKWQSWVKEEEDSLKIIEAAYKAGINFFDTADAYSNGESERILGKAIKQLQMPRNRIVVATKLFFPVSQDISANLFHSNLDQSQEYVNTYGLSRKHVFDAVEASLERLGLEYIDLYQIHRFDHNTPIEETMEALNDLVRSGKVRYIGASSMKAWEFQKANSIAEKNGWARFSCMQNLYNLLYREEEREMIPYCIDQGIAQIPWSPLARGHLTGKNRSSTRSQTDGAINRLFARKEDESNELIIDRVVEISEKRNITAAQVALAWLFSKDHVTAPILGVGKVEHLNDLIDAIGIKLSAEEVKYLEEAYIPRGLIPM
ncbi:NADP-dependent oxidoreductase domain-containing protein [Phycomyces nitens]|nr:NADP-dependent oxidoreductase domain-containing protein [Phycomyces nitens]